MKRSIIGFLLGLGVSAATLAAVLSTLQLGAFAQSQDPNRPPPQAGGDFPPDGPPDFGGPPPFGPGGPGGRGRGPGGPGGPGGMMQKTDLVSKFDKDGDKRLNSAERKAALEFLNSQGNQGWGRRGPRFGREGEQESAQPGQKLTPQEVKNFPDAGLYDPNTLRTLFLQFDDADWEKQIAAFKNTDVDVPARLTVDGKVYRDIGVHFRGMSSFMMVSEGRKRSLKLSLDFAHKEQQIGGYRTLDLLNSHEDPSFLRSVLSLQIARDYMPAPRANFVRVVINGESWGVYVNVEPFNKEFVQEHFGTKQGARWKAPGSPMARASLAYLGEDPAPYKKLYELKSKDEPKAWSDLIKLCRVLNQTSADKLEEALAPLLNVDGALRFLAWENVLINNDGYWVRTSDYNFYQDPKGKFHILPHDSNETFSTPGGPGFGPGMGGGRRGPGEFAGGPGGGGPRGPGGPRGGGSRVEGVKLDPLVAASDTEKPLISKLLAVPAFRARYLGYCKDMAQKWLDWNKLGPVAEQYFYLIAADVRADTRKLETTEAFEKALTDGASGGGGFRGGTIGLKKFADQRRAYLLDYTEAKAEKR